MKKLRCVCITKSYSYKFQGFKAYVHSYHFYSKYGLFINLNIFQVTFLLEIIYHDLSIININSPSINAIIFTNQWMQQVDENLRFDNLTHARV